MAYSWSKAAVEPARKPRRRSRRIPLPRHGPWLFPPEIVQRLEAAIVKVRYVERWYQSLFALARAMLSIVACRNVTTANAAGALEDVVLLWLRDYRQVHADSQEVRDLDEATVRGEFAAILKQRRIKHKDGKGPFKQAIVNARDPSTWPDVDDRPEVNQLVAIARALAGVSKRGEFALPRGMLMEELGLKHRQEAQRLVLLLEAANWIHRVEIVTPDGEVKQATNGWGSTLYRLGPAQL